jgi:hypothetical protein
MSLLGTALLSTITVLIEEGSFKATDTSIRNLGLVLSFWLNFITDICDEMCSNGESDWVMKLVQMADEHGVVIDGPWAMAEKVQKVRDKIEEMDEDEDSEIVADGGEGEIRNWKKWTWKTEVGALLACFERRVDVCSLPLIARIIRPLGRRRLGVGDMIFQRCQRRRNGSIRLERRDRN